MSVRLNNVDMITNYLRERYVHARKTGDAVRNMPWEQREAVISSAEYHKEIKTKYTIKELADALPLSYNKIRYALVGYKPHFILNEQQPPELVERGVRVSYRNGTHNPIFEYDGELMYNHIVATASSEAVSAAAFANEEKREAKPLTLVEKYGQPEEAVKPDTNEAAAPVVAECDNVHIRRWLMHVVTKQFNLNALSTDENNVILVDGSPLVGMEFISADVAEAKGYDTEGVTAITYDQEFARKDELDARR